MEKSQQFNDKLNNDKYIKTKIKIFKAKQRIKKCIMQVFGINNVRFCY